MPRLATSVPTLARFDITHALPLASAADAGPIQKIRPRTLPRIAAPRARFRDRSAAPGSRGRRVPPPENRPVYSQDIRNIVALAVRADSKLPFQSRARHNDP